MGRRTPRQEATHEKTLTPLQERCEQCGQPLWVAYHRHRTVTTLVFPVEIDAGGTSMYPAELPTLSSALPS